MHPYVKAKTKPNQNQQNMHTQNPKNKTTRQKKKNTTKPNILLDLKVVRQ